MAAISEDCKDCKNTSSYPSTHYSLSAHRLFDILVDNHLLREVIASDYWTLNKDDIPHKELTSLTHNSQDATPDTLLFCKGHFQSSYMKDANERGLHFYVSEVSYATETSAYGFIVTDIQKAMALLAAEFYNHPEKTLTMIGITGTKGKTTTTYYLHSILDMVTNHKTALLSSEETFVDGKNWKTADLTTPEALDLYRFLSEAVENKMTHLIMEVSSQAYKTQRVYGIQYAVGVFLNLSPDHISPIEHPTSEDYFYCKRQLIAHSSTAVIDGDCQPYTNLCIQTALLNNTPFYLYTSPGSSYHDQFAENAFSVESENRQSKEYESLSHHAQAVIKGDKNSHNDFEITLKKEDSSLHLGTYHLTMEGLFNNQNAVAAITAAIACGVPYQDLENQKALHAPEKVKVPGRMERFTLPDGTIAYVDYAHNYLSIKSLIDHARREFPDSFITVVSGATGKKALDRREGIAHAASEGAQRLISTTDDSDNENPRDISLKMIESVTNPDLETMIIEDRKEAILTAFKKAHEDHERTGQQHIVFVAGKGYEEWIKIQGKHVPYPSDIRIVKTLAEGKEVDF